MWQDISPRQLFTLFLGSFAFIFGIMLLALCLTVVAKLFVKLFKSNDSDQPDN